MRLTNVSSKLIAAVCCWYLLLSTGWGSEMEEIDGLLKRAETLMRMGVADNGASRSFEEARSQVEAASERLVDLDVSEGEKKSLSLELAAVEENLETFNELYEERFFGIFPLARLISRNTVEDEGFAFTEQLYHPPDVAAVNFALVGLLRQIKRHNHPTVVITSRPGDRGLENIVREAILRDGSAEPVGRRSLVRELAPEDLEAFDRGDFNLKLITRLMAALDLVDFIMVIVSQPLEPDNTTVRQVRGVYYIAGEAVQGSPVDASPVIRGERFVFYGFARDRRDQYRLVLFSELTLLLAALAWFAMVPWGLTRPLKKFNRFAIGFLLFLFGYLFTAAVVTLLRKAIPESTAMAASAMWWPGVLGFFTIIGGGLLAWIGQALVTDIVPGARGARAVGAIFGLVALGAASYFVEPLLLLDGSRGMANIVPLILSSVSLAALFGFAARTGPPVPHYFMTGPLLLAPAVGVCLLKALPQHLWAMVGVSGILCLIAWIRHRVKVSHGTEELDPSPEDAVQTDQERLVKLSKKILKKH